MTAENTKEEHKGIADEISEIFPLAGFFIKNFFQTLAVFIPLLGFFGYAVGRSLFDGWDDAAGIPSTLFPIDVYSLILAGLKQSRPWYWAIGGGCLVLLIIKAIVFWDIHQSRRNENSRRQIAVFLARYEWPRAQHHKVWKELGKRGEKLLPALYQKRRKKYYATYWKAIFSTFVTVFAVGISFYIYQFFQIALLQNAWHVGAQQYVGMYALVTGDMPSRYGSEIDILEYACAAKKEMWKYRMMDIGHSSNNQSGETSEPVVGYMLRNSGNTFLFLTSKGLIIKSFGDSGFEILETAKGTVSGIGEKCKKNS